MVVSHVEVERKYDGGPGGAATADLSGLEGVVAVGPWEEQQLAATYFDTRDLALARARITLRRRTGGSDAGWHLKLPGEAGAREELHLPLGRSRTTVPAELAGLVRGLTRTARLVPVARLVNTRRVRHLLGSEGRVLAELADDDVRAHLLPSAAGSEPSDAWRELEVELVDGPPSLLDAVEERLLAVGATRSTSSSKLARVLAPLLPPEAKAPKPPTRRGPARRVVLAHLAGQVAELQARDPQVRRDVPDALHRMRVASRRLRSALATFGPLLEPEQTAPLRAELRWLAAVLGEARDAEVSRDRLQALVAAEPPELVLGPVLDATGDAMVAQHRQAQERVVAELSGRRYLALLDALDGLVTAPAWTVRAEEPARDVLPRLVRKDWKRVDRLLRAAGVQPSGDQRDPLLHEARKEAKRARYAAEALVPVFGKGVKAFAKQVTAVQEVLGDHQDSVVLREQLRQMGVQAHIAGDSAFTFGRLHALEQLRADEAERAYPELWKAAARDPWLRDV